MTVSFEHRVLYHHEGPLDMEVLPLIVKNLDKLLAAESIRPPLRRKIVSSLIELAQNIIRYGIQSEAHPPLLLLTRTDKGITLTARNLVYYSQEIFLQSYLQNLTQLSRPELEALHHNTLTTGSFSDSGGANLGLVEVLFRCDEFSYELTPVDESHSWFTVKATFFTQNHE